MANEMSQGMEMTRLEEDRRNEWLIDYMYALVLRQGEGIVRALRRSAPGVPPLDNDQVKQAGDDPKHDGVDLGAPDVPLGKDTGV